MLMILPSVCDRHLIPKGMSMSSALDGTFACCYLGDLCLTAAGDVGRLCFIADT